MKKLFILVFITSCFIFTSCDSLWSGDVTTDVLFNINLDDYAQSSSPSDSAVRSVGLLPPDLEEEPDGNNFVVVAIHNTSDNSVIDYKILSLTEAQNTNVTFKGISLRKQVYAKIDVILGFDLDDLDDYDDFDEIYSSFTARTLDTVLKGGENVLIAKPSKVSLIIEPSIGSKVSYGLGDANIDVDPSRRRQDILSDIYDFMSVDGKLVPGATVEVNGTLNVSGTEVWDYPGLTLKRAGVGNIVSISEFVQLTLNRVVIDGDNIAVDSPAVLVGAEATLTMNNGSIIKNNNNQSSGSGGIDTSANSYLNINGGKIIGNTTDSNGGGIGGLATITMTSGEISGNSADNGGGVHVAATWDSGSGSFNFYGGSIFNNTVTNNGGGVYLGVDSSGPGAFASLNMTKGLISGNVARANGGGIYIQKNNNTIAQLTMSGGTITKNSVENNYGGGIYVESFTPDTLKFSGNIVIKDNYNVNYGRQNLFVGNVLMAGNVSKITGAITSPNGSIGLSTSSVGSPFIIFDGNPYRITQTDANKFFSDDQTKNIYYGENPDDGVILELGLTN